MYLWHVATLWFARFLTVAVTIVPGSYGVVEYTDLLGIATRTYDPYVLEPAEYQRFIYVLGDGSNWGLGRYRDPSRGVDTSVAALLGRASAMCMAAFLFGAAVPRSIVSRLRRMSSPSDGRLLGESIAGMMIGAMAQMPAALLLWYAVYPRSRMGAGVFQMHAAIEWALPALSLVLGTLAAWFDLQVERMLRHASERCPKCGFGMKQMALAAMCTDCGFRPSMASCSRLVARNWIVYAAYSGGACIGLLAIWLILGPNQGWYGSGTVWKWLLIRPLE